MSPESESPYQPVIDLIVDLEAMKGHMQSIYAVNISDAISGISHDLISAVRQAESMSFFVKNVVRSEEGKEAAARIEEYGNRFSVEAMFSPVRDLVEKLLQLVTDQRVSDFNIDRVYDDVRRLSSDPNDEIRLSSPEMLRDIAKNPGKIKKNEEHFAVHESANLNRLADEIDEITGCLRSGLVLLTLKKPSKRYA